MTNGLSVESEVVEHIDRIVRTGARNNGNAWRQRMRQLHHPGGRRQPLLVTEIGARREALAEELSSTRAPLLVP